METQKAQNGQNSIEKKAGKPLSLTSDHKAIEIKHYGTGTKIDLQINGTGQKAL